jgi:hypothetical protein
MIEIGKNNNRIVIIINNEMNATFFLVLNDFEFEIENNDI